MKNHSKHIHFQDDIFVYLALTVALKALGIQSNAFLMHQKMPLKWISLLKHTCKKIFTAE